MSDAAAGTTLPPGDVIAGLMVLLPAGWILCLALTPLIRGLARRRSWLDPPDPPRKLHRAPVPRIGGVAVYLSFLLSYALGVATLERLFGSPLAPLGWWAPLILACTAVLMVGLADDIVGVKPAAKLAVQAAAAFYLYLQGYSIELLSNPFGGEPLVLGSLSLPITLVWFVGMSNAFNLIDGLDGLAAGVGLFSTSSVLIAALLNDRPEIALSAAALAGALLGFLRYNFNPATIFLGDCGSLFVGFVLAGLAVRGSMKSSTAIAVAAPLLALAVPIFDTALAALRRLLRGRSIFEADADHIHHRLLRRGLSQRTVVIVLYGVAALFGALSLLTMTGHSQVTGLVMIVFAVTTWVGLWQLASPELATLRALARAGDRRHATTPGRPFGREARFAHVTDAASLWESLIEECRGLGVCGLELRLAARSNDAPTGEVQRLSWEAPGRASEGQWSWTMPLSGARGALGELSLRCPLPGLAPAEGAVLQALAKDVAGALERILLADSRSIRVS